MKKLFNPLGQKQTVEQHRPPIATMASWQTSFVFRANIVQQSNFRNRRWSAARSATSTRRHRPGIATYLLPSVVMGNRQRWCAWSNPNRSCLRGFVLNNNRVPAFRQSLQIVLGQWLTERTVYRPQLFVVALGEARTNVHRQWQTFDVRLDGCWFHDVCFCLFDKKGGRGAPRFVRFFRRLFLRWRPCP